MLPWVPSLLLPVPGPDAQVEGEAGGLFGWVFSRLAAPYTDEHVAPVLCQAAVNAVGGSCEVLKVEGGDALRSLSRWPRAESPSAACQQQTELAELLRRVADISGPVLLAPPGSDGRSAALVITGRVRQRWVISLQEMTRPVEQPVRSLLRDFGWTAQVALTTGGILAESKRARRSADAASHRVIAISRLIELLPATLDLEATVQSVLDALVPYVGDWAVLYLGAQGAGLRRAGVRHLDAGAQRVLEGLACFPQPAVPEALESWLGRREPFFLGAARGEAVPWPIAPEEREAVAGVLAPLSGIAAPLRRGADLLGLMLVGTSAGGQIYGRDELRLLRDMGKQARVALESALLYTAAERARQEREEVMAIVSHDLRNPLQTLRFSTVILGLPETAPEKRHEQLAIIDRSIEAMERLLQDLLDVGRMEAGRFSVEPGPQAAATLLADARQAFLTRAEGKGIALELDEAPEVEVLADREAILRVLGNLLANALSYTPTGGRIRVGAEREGDSVWFRVRDSGPGIAPDLLPHIFERYWQAKKSGQAGAGLGLAIAKGIVESHGGEISARTRPEGGAELRFRLARARPPGEASEKIPAEAGERSSRGGNR
jgi:signal transduction histidine kinase